MSMNGTDESGWQSPHPVLGTNRFDIVKASQGLAGTNPNHDSQVADLRSAGLGVGHYHFLDGSSPEAQADWFFTCAGWRPGEELAVDVEPPFPGWEPVEAARRFLLRLRRHADFPAGLYVSYALLHELDWRPVYALGGGLWGAAYNGTGFGDPSPWPFAAIWQDSDHDESTGGDDDIFFGDLTAWRKYGTPAGTAPVPPAPTPPRPAPKPAPRPAPAPPKPRTITVVVRPGDTLGAIAARTGGTVAAWAAWNHLANPNLIYPGQVLTAPGNLAPAPTVRSYIVRAGDTLAGIAARVGVPWPALAARNNIPDPDRIFPGQVLHY